MKKVGLVILVVSFLIAGFAYADPKETIAVAAEGKTAASKVSSVAARSPYYLIFDGTGNLLEAVENPYKAVKSGTAASVLSFLSKKGVTLIVAGDFGDKMIQDMKSKEIKYLEFKGSVEEALKKVLEGKK